MKRRRLVAYLVVLGVGLPLAVPVVQVAWPFRPLTEPSAAVLALIAALALITLFPLLSNVIGDRDPLEPLIVISGIFFLYYPLNAFGLSVLGFRPAFPFVIRHSSVLLGAFTEGLLVMMVGVVALQAGYRLLSRAETGISTSPVPGRRRFFTLNIVMVWLGCNTFDVLSTVGVFSRSNAMVSLLSTMSMFVPAALLARYYRNPEDRSISFVLSITVVQFLLMSLLEFRLTDILVQMVLLILVYHYLGAGVSYRKLTVIGATTVLLFPLSVIAERLEAGLPLWGGNGQSMVHHMARTFVGRFIGMDAITAIVAQTPEKVPFQGGETLLLVVYSFVPRILCPGKPSIIMCYYNNIYFSGRGASADACAAMTVPGELYWNFGVLGVMVGLAVLGGGLQLLYRWLKTYSREPTFSAVLLYTVVLVNLMRFETGIAQMIVSTTEQLFIAGVFLGIVSEPVDGSIIGRGFERVAKRSNTWRLIGALSGPVTPHSDNVHLMTVARNAFARFRRYRATIGNAPGESATKVVLSRATKIIRISTLNSSVAAVLRDVAVKVESGVDRSWTASLLIRWCGNGPC